MRGDEFIRGIKRFCGFLQDQVEREFPGAGYSCR